MPDFTTKIIKEKKYKKSEVRQGYTDRTLRIDISRPTVTIERVGPRMKKLFVGGTGYDLRMLWESVKGADEPGGPTRWSDPENALCYSCGPLGGTPAYPGAGKSIVMAISPLTGSVMDSNVGGYLGPYTKFAGFDAVAITGKAEKEIVIFIDGINRKIEIMETEGLPDDAYKLARILTDHFGAGKPRNVSVMVSGTAAKYVLMGCLNVSLYDAKRKRIRFKQAGRGGLGSVMAAKNLKAVVIRSDAVKLDANRPADEESMRSVLEEYNREIEKLDGQQNEMSVVGTTHLVPIMNKPELDLLPVNNFQFGNDPRAEAIGAAAYRCRFSRGQDGCWIGCKMACAHSIDGFVPQTGPYRGQIVGVDGPEYETIAACGSNLGIFDPDFVAEMNFYCDTYGLDTISVGVSIGFFMECCERGLIESATRVCFGDKAGALDLVHQMARGYGAGRLVGRGISVMKQIFGMYEKVDPKTLDDIGMESKGLEFSMYMTKESLAQQGGYGLALKGPQHDEAWLIFEDMVRNNLPTFADKAEALAWFPFWRRWFGLMGLCKLSWNDIVPPENSQNPQRPLGLPNARAKIPAHVEFHRRYYEAVTGKKATVDDLLLASERVYTFQRLFNLRLGYGRREHDRIPYRAMGPVTTEEYESRRERYDGQLSKLGITEIAAKSIAEKIALLRKHREKQYELLQDAVYERRGWTKDGIPTLATVKRLGLATRQVKRLLARYGVKK